LIEYRVGEKITPEQFVDVLRRSKLSERRPVDFPDHIEAMLRHANLLVTAWQGELIVGVARSLTDFSFCCYLSDLAVDQKFQRQGIGRNLIRETRNQLGPVCVLILLAAPDARNYYPHVGFTRHESAWILRPGEEIK
jgi:GNAT superfamily N-acetyltransferase